MSAKVPAFSDIGKPVKGETASESLKAYKPCTAGGSPCPLFVCRIAVRWKGGSLPIWPNCEPHHQDSRRCGAYENAARWLAAASTPYRANPWRAAALTIRLPSMQLIGLTFSSDVSCRSSASLDPRRTRQSPTP